MNLILRSSFTILFCKYAVNGKLLFQDMVNLTFEQVIPGTQRLVAKCPIDHPLYIKHKGWSASNPTEAMARYGIPFRAVHTGDIVVPASSNKLNPTTGLSPIVNNSGPQM